MTERTTDPKQTYQYGLSQLPESIFARLIILTAGVIILPGLLLDHWVRWYCLLLSGLMLGTLIADRAARKRCKLELDDQGIHQTTFTGKTYSLQWEEILELKRVFVFRGADRFTLVPKAGKPELKLPTLSKQNEIRLLQQIQQKTHLEVPQKISWWYES